MISSRAIWHCFSDIPLRTHQNLKAVTLLTVTTTVIEPAIISTPIVFRKLPFKNYIYTHYTSHP